MRPDGKHPLFSIALSSARLGEHELEGEARENGSFWSCHGLSAKHCVDLFVELFPNQLKSIASEGLNALSALTRTYHLGCTQFVD